MKCPCLQVEISKLMIFNQVLVGNIKIDLFHGKMHCLKISHALNKQISSNQTRTKNTRSANYGIYSHDYILQK